MHGACQDASRARCSDTVETVANRGQRQGLDSSCVAGYTEQKESISPALHLGPAVSDVDRAKADEQDQIGRKDLERSRKEKKLQSGYRACVMTVSYR